MRPRGVETGFSLEEWVRYEAEAGRILFCKQREREGMKGWGQDECINLDEKCDRAP